MARRFFYTGRYCTHVGWLVQRRWIKEQALRMRVRAWATSCERSSVGDHHTGLPERSEGVSSRHSWRPRAIQRRE